MDKTELQALQKPLKDSTATTPRARSSPYAPKGNWTARRSPARSRPAARSSKPGSIPATGGTGMLACSGDMLLEALVACAGVTLRSVATSLEIPVTGTVRAEGDLDFRGTLGVDRETPVGFRAIRLTFDLDHQATDEQIETLLRLTERYCVVLQTLTGGVPVEVSPAA